MVAQRNCGCLTSEIFQGLVGLGLRNLVQCKVTLSMSGGLELDDLQGPVPTQTIL